MAKCVYCGAETQLYSSGVPVCLACAEDPDAGRKLPSREEGEPSKQKDRQSQES